MFRNRGRFLISVWHFDFSISLVGCQCFKDRSYSKCNCLEGPYTCQSKKKLIVWTYLTVITLQHSFELSIPMFNFRIGLRVTRSLLICFHFRRRHHHHHHHEVFYTLGPRIISFNVQNIRSFPSLSRPRFYWFRRTNL